MVEQTHKLCAGATGVEFLLRHATTRLKWLAPLVLGFNLACSQPPGPCDNPVYTRLCEAAQTANSVNLIVTYATPKPNTALEDEFYIQARTRFLASLPDQQQVVVEHIFKQVPQLVVRVDSAYLEDFLRLDTFVSVGLEEMDQTSATVGKGQ